MASNALLYIDLEGFQEIREIENRETQTKPSAKAKPQDSIPTNGPQTRPNAGCGVPGHRAPTLRTSKNEPREIEPKMAPNTLVYKDLEELLEIREMEN